MELNYNKSSTNNYFNYTVNIGEAILFFIITVFVGQILGGVIMLPQFYFPWLAHILFPLSFLFGFGAAAIIIMFLKQLSLGSLKHAFHTKINIVHIPLAIALYLACMPIAEWLAYIVPTDGDGLLGDLYKMLEESFQMIFKYKVAAFIMVCILAPILEEFIFRGLILRGMLNKGINPWMAIVISSILFGAAHLNPWQFLGAGIISIVLGYTYWRTQSLLLVIFLHFLNNFISFIITLQTDSLEETIFPSGYLVLGSATILLIGIGYIFYEKSKGTALKGIDQKS